MLKHALATVGAVAVLALALTGCSASPNTSAEPSSSTASEVSDDQHLIEVALWSYYQSWYNSDCDSFEKLTTPDHRQEVMQYYYQLDYTCENFQASTEEWFSGKTDDNLVIGQANIDGDTASVTAEESVSWGDDPVVTNYQLTLTKASGSWLVSSEKLTDGEPIPNETPTSPSAEYSCPDGFAEAFASGNAIAKETTETGVTTATELGFPALEGLVSCVVYYKGVAYEGDKRTWVAFIGAPGVSKDDLGDALTESGLSLVDPKDGSWFDVNSPLYADWFRLRNYDDPSLSNTSDDWVLDYLDEFPGSEAFISGHIKVAGAN
ncbi:hypothetical protein [Microbacterium sp. NPDC076895]|uniref:hypothetical protein n=1 Tax=Microbacterium sp. NPDC076895 TaxID=3154957 RepID=UPI003426DE22